MNNHGDVVGWSTQDDSGLPVAFLWRDGAMTPLTWSGAYASRAYRINDAGQVVGIYYRYPPEREKRAFIWEDGIVTDLGLQLLYERRMDLNSSGVAIGSVGILDQTGSTHAGWRWEGGDISALPSAAADPRRISDSGTIIGNNGWGGYVLRDDVFVHGGTT